MLRNGHTDSQSWKGLNNELTVTVSKYESTAVCDTYPQGILLPTACESLLREIPSSQPNTEFVGPGDNPSYTGYSRLPKIYVYGECTISQSELA